jgi:hypothetical protein
MADLTTLLSKFLVALWSGNLYSTPLGGSSLGVPTILSRGRATAQIAAATLINAYAVAADGTFEVTGNILVTVATAFSITMTITYTDEGNNARTMALMFNSSASATATTLGNAQGAVAWASYPNYIRAKAGTTITVATAGTFTTITYNAEAMLKQVA